MQSFDILKTSPISDSFRCKSVSGQYDLEMKESKETFVGQLDLPEEWNVGIIYGNSGTGKSTIAKELFPNEFFEGFEYKEISVLDDMPKESSTKEVSKAFNSVGFSSVPSWFKPYGVLSQGEKMRVDLARCILEKDSLFVFDEFTSVVDRTVAKIGSAAISKAVKKSGKQFIAVSCHSDIIEWLEPDWTFCTNTMKFETTRGLLRPSIKLEIYREKGYWELFRKYHYLNHDINKSSEQFVGYLEGKLCAFVAVLPAMGRGLKKARRSHRIVVLPDFQGIGIGSAFSTFIAKDYKSKGYRFFANGSNPALSYARSKAKGWRLSKQSRSKHHGGNVMCKTIANNRTTARWEYIGIPGELGSQEKKEKQD